MNLLGDLYQNESSIKDLNKAIQYYQMAIDNDYVDSDRSQASIETCRAELAKQKESKAVVRKAKSIPEPLNYTKEMIMDGLKFGLKCGVIAVIAGFFALYFGYEFPATAPITIFGSLISSTMIFIPTTITRIEYDASKARDNLAAKARSDSKESKIRTPLLAEQEEIQEQEEENRSSSDPKPAIRSSQTKKLKSQKQNFQGSSQDT